VIMSAVLGRSAGDDDRGIPICRYGDRFVDDVLALFPIRC
jgi:hypothetical protein